eukprot:14573218-Alexandrium_andersonii.AAC.1
MRAVPHVASLACIEGACPRSGVSAQVRTAPGRRGARLLRAHTHAQSAQCVRVLFEWSSTLMPGGACSVPPHTARLMLCFRP